MRLTTAQLRRDVEAAEAADERIAQETEKEVSFLDKLDRSIAQRGDDLHKLIDDTFRAVAAEMSVLRDAKLKTIAELRGTNAIRPAPPPKQMKPVTEEAEAEP